MSALYTVKIERFRPEDWFDNFFFGSYRWSVQVQPDSASSKTQFELAGSGAAHSVEQAKKKALKHIIGVDKDLHDGVQFGLLLQFVGDVNNMKEDLR